MYIRVSIQREWDVSSYIHTHTRVWMMNVIMVLPDTNGIRTHVRSSDADVDAHMHVDGMYAYASSYEFAQSERLAMHHHKCATPRVIFCMLEMRHWGVEPDKWKFQKECRKCQSGWNSMMHLRRCIANLLSYMQDTAKVGYCSPTMQVLPGEMQTFAVQCYTFSIPDTDPSTCSRMAPCLIVWQSLVECSIV